jgi:hypothetical protein
MNKFCSYVRPKTPEDFTALMDYFALLGLEKSFEHHQDAGHSVVFKTPAAAISLYTPTPGSTWVGPPGAADFSVGVEDSEIAFTDSVDRGVELISNSKNPETLAFCIEHSKSHPLDEDLANMKMTRESWMEYAANRPRSFMARVGGFNVAVSQIEQNAEK